MKPDVKLMIIYLVWPVALLAGVVGWQMLKLSHQAPSPSSRYLDTASALEARGLYSAALDELDQYRKTAFLSADKEADLLYKMASMADEKLGDCKRALPYYTMADALNPNASWKSDSGKRTVICLEKIGKTRESAALMNQLTGGGAPDDTGPLPGDTGPVVALVDGHSVTWPQVAAALAVGDTASLELRQRMLQEYIVVWVLSEEAVRKGYDSDPAAKARIDWSRRQALAGDLLAKDIAKPDDQQAINKLIEETVKLHNVRTFKDAVPAP